jgi:hypothetical protein
VIQSSQLAGAAQATWGGLATLFQHMTTDMTAKRRDAARLRKAVHSARTRFMGSIETGKDDAYAAEEYTNAIKQYRIAIFSEIRAYGGTQRKV